MRVRLQVGLRDLPWFRQSRPGAGMILRFMSSTRRLRPILAAAGRDLRHTNKPPAGLRPGTQPSQNQCSWPCAFKMSGYHHPHDLSPNTAWAGIDAPAGPSAENHHVERAG
jgi:hypothetical protein